MKFCLSPIVRWSLLSSLLVAVCLPAINANDALSYSFDGRGNNQKYPEWGVAFTPRIRQKPEGVSYKDGESIPKDENNSGLPSARRVMEELFRMAPPRPDKKSNHLLIEVGHFIVQDIIGASLKNVSESFPIPCDGELNDILFCPVTGQAFNMSDPTIDFFRHQHVQENNRPRKMINAATSYLDLSHMYGVTEEDTMRVRDGEPNGMVKLDDQNLLPVNGVFSAGYNASPGVYALYVIFMRYHNKMALQFKEEFPAFDDDTIFDMARHHVIAVYQSYVEQKYVPTLLGDQLEDYPGYDEEINPSIDEFFAAVSFRYAHSSFSGVVRVLNEDFTPSVYDPVYIRDVFKQPPPNDLRTVTERVGGIEPILRGLVVLPAKEVDASIVDDLNIWSEATSVVDVQRARDVGIPSYNEARKSFGLDPMASIDELAGKDEVVLNALKNLYNGDIDKVDAYVGSLVERPVNGLDQLGPLLTYSIMDQFTRIRNGDRNWYRNRYSASEFEAFPTLSEVIKEVCEGMDSFPDDPYQIMNGFENLGTGSDGEGTCDIGQTQLSLLGGQFLVGWALENVDDSDEDASSDETISTRSIDVTLSVKEGMEGPGFIGIGWGKQGMYGAEIWFCTVDEDMFPTNENRCTMPEENPSGVIVERASVDPMFRCCVREGGRQALLGASCTDDRADRPYELEVVEWCLSGSASTVVVRAPVCNDDFEANGHFSKRDCFQLSSRSDGMMDFIVAYNPFSQFRSHGFQRRTAAQVDLLAGRLTQSETQIADTGLIATHGTFMLIAWMFCAPWAVFIMRFMKTRKWHLVVHVSLMGFVGSLMIPLLIGVEASVGATDKTANHSLVGICLMVWFFFMAFAGRIRFLIHEGHRVGKRKAFLSKVVHIYGGYVMLVLGWWNCYTGLVRIGPEDSYVQIVWFSSKTLGYNMPIFGHIRKYVFFPYLSFVVVMFMIAEYRLRRKKALHQEKLDGYLKGLDSIWNDDGSHLEIMTIDTFLEVTRLGSPLCIIDGRVIDISAFVDVHPGGPDLLRFSVGTDITHEILGQRDVDGVMHGHSKGALKLLNSLVRARLNVGAQELEVKSAAEKKVVSKSARRSMIPQGLGSTVMDPLAASSTLRASTQAFRPARVVAIQHFTPGVTLEAGSKPVIVLRLSMPRSSGFRPLGGFMTGGSSDNDLNEATFLPSSAFTFRGSEKSGSTFERQYTPVHIENAVGIDSYIPKKDSDEETFDFLISLIPGGKMSKFFKRLKIGKTLLVQGPKINPDTLASISSPKWNSIIMLAAGTGISPMLQVIDYHLSAGAQEELGPRLFLIWVLKSPKHAYPEKAGLNSRLMRSKGRLKWLIIYSSSKSTEKSQVESTKRKGLLRDSGGEHILHESMKNMISLSRLAPIKAFFGTDPRQQICTKNFVATGRQTTVKDVLMAANDQENIACIEKTAIPRPDDDAVAQEDFWNRSRRCIDHRLDRAMLKDILNATEMFVDAKDGSESVRANLNEELGPALEDDSKSDEAALRSDIAPSAPKRFKTVMPSPLARGGFSSMVSNYSNGSDVEGGPRRPQDMLVTVSGSPAFELDVSATLSMLGLDREQIVAFHQSTRHI